MRLLKTVIPVVLLLGAFAGCSRAPRFVSPYLAPDADLRVPAPPTEALYSTLQERSQHHQTVWAKGDVTVRQRGVDGRLFFDALLLYREPDTIRLRGSRIPIGTLFEVGMNPTGSWVLLNRENQLFEGSQDDLRRQTVAMGSLTPRDLLGVLQVNDDLRERLSRPGEWTRAEEPTHLLLSTVEPDGHQMLWRLRSADRLVSERARLDASGREEIRVTYLRYELQGTGEPMPTEAEIRLDGGATTVRLRVSEYKLDPPLPARFGDPPAGSRLGHFPLSQLGDQVVKASGQ